MNSTKEIESSNLGVSEIIFEGVTSFFMLIGTVGKKKNFLISFTQYTMEIPNLLVRPNYGKNGLEIKPHPMGLVFFVNKIDF